MTSHPSTTPPAASGTVTTAATPIAAADVAAAQQAQRLAYAPYSQFQVGAVVGAGDRRFIGANIENASYGLTVCAERNAVAAAVLAGVTQLDFVVIATNAEPPSSPCGMCRQVLLEFAADPQTFVVTAINHLGAQRQWRLRDLIPDGFSRTELERSQRAKAGTP